MEKLDPRLNACRSDLADERLRNRVEAVSFVKADAASIVVAVAGLHRTPDETAMQLSQALFGEKVEVFERRDNWAWVKLMRDGYVGYVRGSALGPPMAAATHMVANVQTIIFAKADLKSQPARHLYMGSAVCVSKIEGTYAHLITGGAVHAAHLAVKGEYEIDYVSVAERFLHVPYYWGAKTHAGIDCSGLVQISLQAAGVAALRDSDMQEASLGAVVKDAANLLRGDFIFWPGHVGIMQSPTHIIHANGLHMKVTSELLSDVVARNDKPISSIRRLSV